MAANSLDAPILSAATTRRFSTELRGAQGNRPLSHLDASIEEPGHHYPRGSAVAVGNGQEQGVSGPGDETNEAAKRKERREEGAGRGQL